MCVCVFFNKTGCLYERNIQFQFGTRVAKKLSVVKKKKKKQSMSWAESKEAGTEACQGREELLSVD